MNTTTQATQAQQTPQCFGTHLWSATAPDCVGGPDPGYTHPTTGAHSRERCRWYQACASVNSRVRGQQSRPVIPVENLTRNFQQPQAPLPSGVQPPPRPVAPPPQVAGKPPLQSAQPYGYPQYQPQQQYYQQPHYPQQQQYYQQPMATPYVAQTGPQQVHVQVQQPGAQMPSYLTMPEPIDHEEGTGMALGRTLIRSALKAVGHSVSSFFDHVPLKPHKPPPQQ